MEEQWKETFKNFYITHKRGSGSSCWLVGPSTVKTFIEGILSQQKAALLEKVAKDVIGEDQEQPQIIGSERTVMAVMPINRNGLRIEQRKKLELLKSQE